MDPLPDVYACPSEVRRTATAKRVTSYVAVVGDRTVWPGTQGRSMAAIADGDGTSNTLLVVEAGGLKVPWMKPDDISLDDCVQLLHSTETEDAVGHRSENFFYVYNFGRNVAMVDGSVHFFRHGLPSQVLSDLMTIDDGNSWNDADSERAPSQSRRPKLDNWFRLGLFFLIAIFPTPWVWLNPGPGRRQQQGPAQKTPDGPATENLRQKSSAEDPGRDKGPTSGE